MHLTEVSLDGIRDAAPSVRLSLVPGYNVLTPSASESPPLAAVLTALLYRETWGDEPHLLAPGVDAAKAMVGIVGRDQLLYRVLRQLGGRGLLQRVPRGGPAPETLAQDAKAATPILRGQVGIPSPEQFRALCVLSAAQRPSATSKSAAGASGTGISMTGPVRPAPDVPAARARAEALARELELSREVDALQFRSDGLANEIFQLEAALRSVDAPRSALADAERALAGLPDPAARGLGADLAERVAAHATNVQKRDEALQRVSAEREEEGVGEEAWTPPPPWREGRFWASIAGTLVLLVVAMASEGGGRYLSLLAIPMSGFAALLGLQYVEKLQAHERSGRRESLFSVREKKIEEAFQREFLPLQRALEALNLRSPEEIGELLAQRASLAERVEQLRAQLGAAESDPGYRSARENHARLGAEQAAVNAQLTEKGAYVREAREVERELSRVQESIDLALQGGGGLAGDYEDPCPAWLAAAASLVQSDIPSVVALMRERLTQYLAALTDKRYLGVDFSPTGAATVLAVSGAVPAGNLPGRDLDLLYLALRLTFAEKVAAKERIPLLIEGTPSGVEPAKAGLLARMLKHLGTHTQVLHVTADRAYAPLADLTGVI